MSATAAHLVSPVIAPGRWEVDPAHTTLEFRVRHAGLARVRGVFGEFEGAGKDPWGGQRVSFAATGKIDRRDYGLTWNVALETGGILVSTEIKIAIEAQAVLQADG